MEPEYHPKDLVEVLSDPRVLRGLELALRDHAIRRRFRQLRKDGTVVGSVTQLSNEFYLSDEHIRTIIYRKRRQL